MTLNIGKPLPTSPHDPGWRLPFDVRGCNQGGFEILSFDNQGLQQTTQGTVQKLSIATTNKSHSTVIGTESGFALVIKEETDTDTGTVVHYAVRRFDLDRTKLVADLAPQFGTLVGRTLWTTFTRDSFAMAGEVNDGEKDRSQLFIIDADNVVSDQYDLGYGYLNKDMTEYARAPMETRFLYTN